MPLVCTGVFDFLSPSADLLHSFAEIIAEYLFSFENLLLGRIKAVPRALAAMRTDQTVWLFAGP